MKKSLFMVGPDGLGKYNACRKLIDENNINDMVVFDVGMFLKRYYYKQNISEPFDSWKGGLKEHEVQDMISAELVKRLEICGARINNVVICGDLSLEQIMGISKKTNMPEYNLIFIDGPKEIIHRNLSLKTKSEINVANFVTKLKYLYETRYKNLIELSLRTGRYYYINNANQPLDTIIGQALNYNIPQKHIKLENGYEWPIEPRYMISPHDKYGLRPVHMILGNAKFHSGFDIIAETSTPIRSATSGIVTYSGLDERILSGQSQWNQRYGKLVELSDCFGRKQIYAHLRTPMVKEGDIVKQGDLIGLSGCSGGARVPHLHYEVRKFNVDHSGEKNTINPLELLPHRNFEQLKERFKEKPYNATWEMMMKKPWGVTDKDINYCNNEEYIR